MLDFLNEINKKLVTKRIFEYEHPWSDEKKYMDHFPDPQNDVQRSYYKYLCECYTLHSKLVILGRNVAALFMLVYYLLKRYPAVREEGKFENLIINGDKAKEDSVPDEFKHNMMHISISSHGSLTASDKKFILSIWAKHPLSFFFVLKTLIKLSVYSEGIRKYSPKRILCTSEASFPVAILTAYCESQNIEHVNFQHGLLAYKCRIAFSRFSRQLVWERCFENALKNMRDDTTVFDVVRPDSLKYPVSKDKEIKGRFTYYLQEIDQDMLKKFSTFYYQFSDRGIRFILRPHPRYNDVGLIKQYIPEAEIEDIKAISIDESLNKSEYVIARGSTVLYQAKVMGKKVLIDDISMPDSFAYLKDRVFSVWFDDVEEYLLSKLELEEK